MEPITMKRPALTKSSIRLLRSISCWLKSSTSSVFISIWPLKKRSRKVCWNYPEGTHWRGGFRKILELRKYEILQQNTILISSWSNATPIHIQPIFSYPKELRKLSAKLDCYGSLGSFWSCLHLSTKPPQRCDEISENGSKGCLSFDCRWIGTSAMG